MSERIVDLPNGGAADEYTRLHDAKTLYGYDLHEEIVRCRDCAFGYQHDGKRFPKECKGMWYCVAWSDGMQGEWTIPDGYCHKAEPRKEQA